MLQDCDNTKAFYFFVSPVTSDFPRPECASYQYTSFLSHFQNKSSPKAHGQIQSLAGCFQKRWEGKQRESPSKKMKPGEGRSACGAGDRPLALAGAPHGTRTVAETPGEFRGGTAKRPQLLPRADITRVSPPLRGTHTAPGGPPHPQHAGPSRRGGGRRSAGRAGLRGPHRLPARSLAWQRPGRGAAGPSSSSSRPPSPPPPAPAAADAGTAPAVSLPRQDPPAGSCGAARPRLCAGSSGSARPGPSRTDPRLRRCRRPARPRSTPLRRAGTCRSLFPAAFVPSVPASPSAPPAGRRCTEGRVETPLPARVSPLSQPFCRGENTTAGQRREFARRSGGSAAGHGQWREPRFVGTAAPAGPCPPRSDVRPAALPALSPAGGRRRLVLRRERESPGRGSAQGGACR